MIGLKCIELIGVEDGRGAYTVGGDQYWFPKEGYIPPGACGATTGANLLAYMLRSRPELYASAQKAGLDGLAAPVPQDDKPYHGLAAPVPPDLKRDHGLAGPVPPDDKPSHGLACPIPPELKPYHGLAVPVPPNSKTGYLEFMKKAYKFLAPHIGGLMADDFVEGIERMADEYSLPIATELLKVPIARAKRPSFQDAASFIRASLEDDMPVAFLILSSGYVANLDTWHWVTILALDEDAGSVRIADNGKALPADLGKWLETSIMGGAFVRLTEIC